MTTPPNKVVADAEARRVWNLYGFQSPKELVLEDLAFAMGVVVIEGRLDGAVARLVRKGSRGVIRVTDSLKDRGRRRFGVAHELGHWVLHKHVSQVLACTEEDLASYKGSAPEIEANTFAAGLLMPEAVFLKRIEAVRPSAELVKALADEFQTSLTATATRLVELKQDYCAVVISERGKIRWWRASRDFDGSFWLDAGSTLSSGTLAGAVFRGERVTTKPQQVDVSAWGLDPERIQQDSIFEQVIPLERYGQVISLLWL